MCASEDCDSSHDGEPIIYRRANWVLFLATVKSTPFLATQGCLKNAVTQFIGRFVPDELDDYRNLDVRYEDNT